MKPEDDELIAHIKESLAGYEENYTPGAWEGFEKKQKKKRWVLWLGSLSSAAAILLIGFTLLYTNNESVDMVTDLQSKNNNTKPGSVLPAAGKDTVAASAAAGLNIAVTQRKDVVAQKSNKSATDPLIASVSASSGIDRFDTAKVQPVTSTVLPIASIVQPVDVTSNPLVANRKDFIVVPSVSDSAAVARTPVKEQPVKAPVKENNVRSFQDFLDAEVKSNSALASVKMSSKKNSKWELGVVVAPSMGNSKKLNMGYGVSMGYALSDKVSINSGISYTEMGASKDLTSGHTYDSPSAAGTSSLVRDTKSLQSVDANLVGIDIPLELKYYVTKRFYTNVGISAFAVLNQTQSNKYLQGKVEDMSVENNNLTGFKSVFQRSVVTESVPASAIKDDKYLGFYNISFGYKQNISDKRSLSIEPFMKLPIKEFTKENLHLLGTGVRLKFDF